MAFTMLKYRLWKRGDENVQAGRLVDSLGTGCAGLLVPELADMRKNIVWSE